MGLFPCCIGGLADLAGAVHGKPYPLFNDLKLRGSFGEAGNNRIAPFQYLTQFNTNSQYGLLQNLITAYASAGLANPNLKWETTTSRDIGVDATVLAEPAYVFGRCI